MRISQRRPRGGQPFRGTRRRHGFAAGPGANAPWRQVRPAFGMRIPSAGKAKEWADPGARPFGYGLAEWHAAVDAVPRGRWPAVGARRPRYEVGGGVLHFRHE